MHSKQDVHESSVMIAFAELERLERDRSSFVSAKRAAHQQLGRQARDIEVLRARLLAERPHAWARVRRERERLAAIDEQVRVAERARVEAEHQQRLARYAVELERTRAAVAELAARPQEVVPPVKRALQWSMPAMATMLVAFLGMFAVTDDANAGAPQLVIEAPLAAAVPTLAQFDDTAVLAPVQAIEPAPAVAPAPAPSKSVSKSSSKPSSKSASKSASKPAASPAKPVTKPRTDPVKLGSFNDDPLG